MAEERIVQNLIRRLGQSQPERYAQELGDHFADVEERDPQRLMEFAVRLAPLIRYYDAANQPAGDWTPFFRKDWMDDELAGAGDVTPHLALFKGFLALNEEARRVVNRLTGEHLKFFYERVLGFERRPALPDRAHVLVEPKNNTAPIRIGPGHRLTAGKGPEGEQLYAPVGEAIVRGAKVVSLRSIFVDAARTMHAAPVANSADGLGGEWETPDRNWRAFGGPDLPEAALGFGLASPVLRMAEGRREIACLLQLDRVDAAAIGASGLVFEAYVTGAKGWLGPYRPTAGVEGGALALAFTVEATEPAVVDYSADLHGLAYSAEAPVVQFLIRAGAGASPIGVLGGAIVRGTRVKVAVSGITSLTLQSDAGPLDPKRAFLPFGPLPAAGSRFVIEYPEALGKKLSQLKVRLRWLGVPSSFASHYQGYSAHTFSGDEFGAYVAFHDGGSWEVRGTLVRLFGAPDADGWIEFGFNSDGTSTSPPPSKGRQVHALGLHADKWARKAERDTFGLAAPGLKSARLRFDRRHIGRFLDIATAAPRHGAVMFALSRDFLHATYRQKTIENAFAEKKVVLREPYTPTIQAIELDYTASTGEIDVSSTRLEDFSNPDLAFFHVDAFGQRREHGYRRANVAFLPGADVALIPDHRHEGELFVGLEGVEARDSVNLLVQVAEATADPDLPAATVEWAALCDNDWRPLQPEEVVADGSHHFRRSGIVSLIVPREATTVHTVMPSNMAWLRAAVAEHSGAACRLVAVEANAVEVKRVAPAALDQQAAALPPGSIAKLKTPLPGVKAVRQPYASFGGRPRESSAALYRRASERLRHKSRCITPWDYERIVLEAFPSVHRVKCVPHARDGAWLSPGHVLLVVVPDLRGRMAPSSPDDEPADRTEPVAVVLLQPRVDLDTLTEIRTYVQDRCGSQITVHVKNPLYQQVRLAFQVKFARGRDFHYYRRVLSNELIRFLSPWAFESIRHPSARGERPTPSFGGRVFRSVLLDFIEELDYVDYLTSFSMRTETAGTIVETAEAVPERPDAILVSDAAHDITEVV